MPQLAQTGLRDLPDEPQAHTWARIQRVLLFVLIALLVAGAYLEGLRVRQQVWQLCDSLHYQGDLLAAHRHGNRILMNALESEGATAGAVPRWSSVWSSYLEYYDRVIDEHPDGKLDLDYPPLRLLTMCIWSRLIFIPGREAEDYDINQCEPLLRLNTCTELLAAIAAFLLVRYWVDRGQPAGAKSDRGWLCGLLAAALVWFDPSSLLDAHGWPQWDAWVVPFYLFAAWAASTDRWFAAGIILGIGGAAKGQLWVAAPVFLLWPVFAWRWMSFFRIIAGAAVGLACIQSIWTLSIPSARLWIGGCLAAMLITFVGGRWFKQQTRVKLCLVAAAIVIWPWFAEGWDWTLPGAFILVAIMILMVWRISVKSVAARFCVLMAAAVFLASVHYQASIGWFKVGILFGANRNEHKLFAGISNNLPALLNMRFGWHTANDLLTKLNIGGTDYAITIGNLLQAIFGLGIVICAAAVSVHWRKGDPRGLLAIAMPWVLFYALMPQMRERYLLWGGVVSAIWIGVGFAPLLMHLLITLLSVQTMLHVMMDVNPNSRPEGLYRILQRTHPDIGWLVLLATAVSLYWTVTPGTRIRDRAVMDESKTGA